MNTLETIAQWTTIVVDTGDINAIKEHKPTDATTNPSLILKAAEDPAYRPLIDSALHHRDPDTLMDQLFVNFGVEILKLIPGRVSTEVDAHLSFDIQGSVDRAHNLISLYEKQGIPRERILIKLASTWEGAQAARILELEGIHCNMTLMFSLAQAVIAADVNATLISPFVGRILDWHKKHSESPIEEDPGVHSVQTIYNYYKANNISTQVMGASFRNTDEIIQLAGCDLLTIAPNLMHDLTTSLEPVTRKLSPDSPTPCPLLTLDEKAFRWHLNEDPMATEKLAEGIRAFAADYTKLKNKISIDL